MKILTKKILAILLIMTFIGMSVGSALGLVLCEYGCTSKIHKQNHADNPPVCLAQNQSQDRLSSASAESRPVDTCCDHKLQLDDGETLKTESPDAPTFHVGNPHPVALTTSQAHPLNNIRLQSLPRVSKTIRALRTTVILI